MTRPLLAALTFALFVAGPAPWSGSLTGAIGDDEAAAKAPRRTKSKSGAKAARKTKAHPPKTRKAAVTDTYHGVEVSEDYRWLEDAAAEEVKEWTKKQNEWARKHLDALPGVQAVRKRMTEVLGAEATSHWSLQIAGGKLFAKKHQPPKEQPFLVVMEGPDKPETARVLVDPQAMDAAGTTAIDWYEASPDGSLVAVSLSKGGTESGDLHIFDVASGKQVHEVVPGVNGGTAGGDMAWAPDGKGFYYSRYPRPGERPPEDAHFYTQVWFHALGTDPSTDRYELGKDFPRIAEIELKADQDTGRVLATVQFGDGGEFSLHLRDPDGTWRTFSTFGDRLLQAAFGPGDAIYVLSRAEAPRGKLICINAKTLDLERAHSILHEGSDTLVDSFWSSPSVLVTDSRLYVQYQLGGPSTIRVFDHTGKPLPDPDLPGVSSIGGLTPLGGDEVLISARGYTNATSWLHYDPAAGTTRRTALSTDFPVDFSDVEVVRELATSKDGTKVPVNLLIPKGTPRDGSAAAVIYGYGGYGVNIVPRFRPRNRVLFDAGVLYVVTNLRGGGEFGEQWHRQGNLTKKQNVFDDFAAAVEHVVERGYTSHERLAILGGSNGGLLMGATMTQHPKIAAAVVSFVGIYDMLRVELSPNGAFNVTEFGTVKDEAQFKALHAYSPYHHVADGSAFPPTLLLTGENDPRVDPMQSRKFTARLQAATSASPTEAPVLLRTSANAGHGGDSSLSHRVEEYTDAYSFLLHHLEVEYSAP